MPKPDKQAKQAEAARRQRLAVGLFNVEHIRCSEADDGFGSPSAGIVSRRATIGARIAIPFSPRRTNRPSVRQV
jgi:hypothetical protein